MHLEYQINLVIISIALAICGCGGSLILVNGSIEQTKQKIGRILAATAVFASGVWGMHFVGMLALKMPVEITYDPFIVGISFVVMNVVVLPAMIVINGGFCQKRHHILAIFSLAMAVCLMHYLGMAAIQMQTMIVYHWFWLWVSLFFALTAAYGFVWVSECWVSSRNKTYLLFVNCSAVTGISISLIHYLAMMAVQLDDNGLSFDNGMIFDHDNLAYLIGSLTVLNVLVLVFMSFQQNRIELWKILLIIGLSELTIMLMMPVILPKNTSDLLKSAIDVLLLMLFLSPVAWRLKHAADELYHKQQDAEKNLYSQHALNQLLSLPLHQIDIEELLNRALKIILNIPWLEVEAKGAIFVNNPSDKRLKMLASYNLDPQVMNNCAEVSHGSCLCGLAAVQREIQHHSHVDVAHTMQFTSMKDHGHYIVPLISEQQLVGVLCLYLQAGHEFEVNESETLKVVGTTLSELIRSKQTLDELNLANTVFKHSLTCLMVADAENRILNINPAFTELTGYTLDEVKGQNPAMLNSGQHDEFFYENMWHGLNANDNWQGEIWDKKKNGEIFLEWLSIKVVRDQKGKAQNYIAAFADITQQKEAEKRIRQLAYYDNLTGLANRTLFYDRLEQAIILAKRNHTKLALMFIDLDRFKEVNDTLGHDAGDELLKTVAARIGSCLRESDVLARMGGDEFVVLLRELDGSKNSVVDICKKIAENILRRLGEGHQYQRFTFYGGGSIGVVIYPDNAEMVSDLLQRADTAMYEAKNAGRNTYRFFSSELALALENKLSLNNAMHCALENREFSLRFQPLVNMNDLNVIGAELLLTWNSPILGLVPPAQFIPLAEENGLINALGNWVIEQACKQLRQWNQQNKFTSLYLSINVSIQQLIKGGFADHVLALCNQFDIPAGRLELEISEAGLALYPDSVADILNQLQQAGFNLAIDDFGMAYSCLCRLKSFNVDILKIDRSFVNDMLNDPDDAKIVKAIIDLAEALGLSTLAEGVETAEQLELLKQFGCMYGQGYLFGKPMSIAEFEQLLSEN